MLTDVKVRTAKPKEKDYKLSDEKGLFLLVKTNGARYWRMKYRYAGKEKLLALGVYPEISLAMAREARDKARLLLQQGTDPMDAKREDKRAAEALTNNTFEKIAREWHRQQSGRWVADHAARVLKTLEDGAFPDFGHEPVDQITPPQVLAAVRKIETRDALETAARTLQRIGAVFKYAVQTGRCTYNPAADLSGALKQRKVKHRLALSRDDLPEFLKALDNYQGDAQTRLALQLIVLTFVRTNELRGAQWCEFELDGQAPTWRIPAERMKMKAEHLVPLSRQAIAILEALRPLSGNGRLLFPGQRNTQQPISQNTLIFALYRMGYHQKATVHGFRATASTILNECGFKPDVIERQLAHVEGNKVRAAYHRTEYLEDRRAMMQWWADYLDSTKTGGNVVAFRKSA